MQVNTEPNQMIVVNRPSVVSFAGYSGSGKTTLVEAVIRLLCEQGYRTGAVKHDGHHFDIDKPGKDSWRMTQAGAAVTVITDSEKLAMIKKHDVTPTPEAVIEDYFSDMDIVIIEGWKDCAPNRIEVHRQETGRVPICLQPNATGFVAIATDTLIKTTLPKLNINNPQEVVDFIVSSFL
jgi:molybdopterin-guanine dinucleotide biosynthesis protein MobB